ncbi:uncharacterized protein LODBEIA_P03000 [Lodderomyces beijingensis]|uniref:SCP domain-containing protein n=1 Tax=Lodderomyces beijingensis TaxID=1775926 RepID=A0ABP0ZGW5_9ASCO
MKVSSFAAIATLLATTTTMVQAAPAPEVEYVTETHRVTVTAGAKAAVEPTSVAPEPSTSTWVFSTSIQGHEIVFTSVVDPAETSQPFRSLWEEHVVIQSGDSITTETLVVKANPTTVVTSTLSANDDAAAPAPSSVAQEQVKTVETYAAAVESKSSEQPTTQAQPTTTRSSQNSPAASSSAPAPAKAAVTASANVGGTQDSSFSKAILDAHNAKRALHGVGALSWDQDAYNYAQNYANQYSCSGNLKHSGGKFGENLAVGYPDGPSAVEAWYDEGQTYNYNAANTFDHFTAIVWKSTTKLGCAYKDCRAQNWGLYVICSYDPAGNVIGSSKQNVLPPV